jgi:acetylornithine deacetylase/succinyl-diaminopimelate desuccinylase-like protein
VANVNHAQLRRFTDKVWLDEITPCLVDYIRIPNKSPAFDPAWQSAGHMDKAVDLLSGWARAKLREIPGAMLSVERLPGRTPLILIEIPGTTDDTALLYGHLDKQPEMTGWAEGKGPWLPVLEDDKLYGRGGADDGYAIFGAITAILALREQGAAHARAVILIEASEESGSPDLPPYLEALSDRIGKPSLAICLDSGCGDYERLWLTTSLRGMAAGTLRVDVLEEGVHSGDASGVTPSSFRILRELLARIEDGRTGRVLLDELSVDVPQERIDQARVAANALGDKVWRKFPMMPGMTPMSEDLAELVLNRTWRPALSVIGLDGAPKPGDAGNVLRPFTSAQLSMRLPPTADGQTAARALKDVLERDPPYGARVSFEAEKASTGWNAPATAPWLARALEQASETCWGKPMAMMGEGGTIPFMGMLGDMYPGAQFVVTGVLGPNSNAHGPNEFLHLPTARRVTETVSLILSAHAGHR